MSIRNNYRGHNYLRIGEKITQRVIRADNFNTISVSGQSDIVATSGTALTIVEAEGIVITTNASTDTLTFTPDSASATEKGIVELATDAETLTGTDAGRVVTPANLAAKFADVTWTSDTSSTGKALVMGF